MFFSATIILTFVLGVVADIYTLSATIPFSPAIPNSVDQSVIYNNTYYLSDRTNQGIHVVSLLNNTQTTFIKGFVTGSINGSLSSTVSGPNGVVILPDRNELWAGDGDGSIKIIDLLTNTIVKSILTGSKKRVDEFAYDPTSRVVVATNPSEEVPFVTVLNSTSRTIIGIIPFPGTDGIEQPAYNAATSQFYVSISSTPSSPGGAVAVLNVAPRTLAIQSLIKTPDCDNAGIVFGLGTKLLVSCSDGQIPTFNISRSYIFDVYTGALVANVSGVSGVDQVAFSSKTGFFYATAYLDRVNNLPAPHLAIIGPNGTVVQNIVTDNITAHSVAVNQVDGGIVIPVQGKGILVYHLTGATANGAWKHSVNFAAVILAVFAFAVTI